MVTHATDARIFEVTREGKVVWEFAHPGWPRDSSRAYRYGPNHPGILSLLGFYRTAYRAALASQPAARSLFDIYLMDGALAYVKETCEPEDAERSFFLHIVPERKDDLPQERREFGFDNLDFEFFLRGALFAGRCVATVPLPDYAIASIRTGQFVRGEGRLWSVEFAVE